MVATATAAAGTKDIAPGGGIRFTVASRPQRRFSATQTVSNLNGATSFQPIPLPATGFVRKISLYFSFTGACASAGAVVAGDGPWNLVSGVTLTDATGQPIVQPINGINLYLLNKYFSSGTTNTSIPRAWANPQAGPEFAFSATATTMTAKWRVDIDLEQDCNNGYGCVPNLDANASPLLKIDVAAYTAAFTGTTTSAASLTVRVEQHYWAPVGGTLGGVAVNDQTVGLGDFLETRLETQTVTASAENIVNVNNRGGLIRGILAISRAAGTRTAFTAASNVGLVLDNTPIDEGITLESHQDLIRREYGYLGADLTTSYAPLSAGTLPGLDTGVLPWNFGALSGGRDSWLATRVGSLLQLKVTPGASATSLEIITLLMQVKDTAAFYASSSLD